MIDWAKVTELRDEIGAEDFAEVVELFLEEVDEAIGQLRGGLPEEKLECCLHFLKGSALNLGFRAFSDLCSAGESAAAGGDYGAIDVGAVIASYDASKAMFLEEFDGRMAA
jgi:HPt (histidine-containing phosphotransfer) domain-containing protein